MVTVIAKLKAQSGKEDLLAEECINMAGIVRETEKGCLMYVPHVSLDDASEITFYEQYVDQTAFDAHVKTPHFKQFSDKISQLLDGRLQVQFLRALV